MVQSWPMLNIFMLLRLQMGEYSWTACWEEILENEIESPFVNGAFLSTYVIFEIHISVFWYRQEPSVWCTFSAGSTKLTLCYLCILCKFAFWKLFCIKKLYIHLLKINFFLPLQWFHQGKMLTYLGILWYNQFTEYTDWYFGICGFRVYSSSDSIIWGLQLKGIEIN